MAERRSADHEDQAHDEKAGDSVRAVDRALDILLAFQPHDDALTVSELLRRVDLSRPTLYRLLRTLQQKQFLIASGDPQRFRLGPRTAPAIPLRPVLPAPRQEKRFCLSRHYAMLYKKSTPWECMHPAATGSTSITSERARRRAPGAEPARVAIV